MLFSQESGIYRAPLVTPSVWDPRAEFPTGVSKGEGPWDELTGTVRSSFWYESSRCSRLGWGPGFGTQPLDPGNPHAQCPLPGIFLGKKNVFIWRKCSDDLKIKESRGLEGLEQEKSASAGIMGFQDGLEGKGA